MTAFIKWILSVLVLASLVIFALLNRGDVTFSGIYPVGFDITIPLSLLVLIVFAKGFIIGGVMVWLDASGQRAELRHLRKYKKQQEKQAVDVVSSSQTPASTQAVTLPH